MGTVIQSACQAAEFNIAATRSIVRDGNCKSSIVIVNRSGPRGRWVPGSYAVWAIDLQGGHTCTSREAARQLRNAGRRRRSTVREIRVYRGDDFIVETAEEEDLVLHPRTPDGCAGKFIVKAWRFCERGAVKQRVLLQIRQCRERGVALRPVNRSVPGIRARLGRNVYHRTAIAPVLRAEIAGDHLVLVDALGVSHEDSWSRYRI